jgi:hypothetical protein
MVKDNEAHAAIVALDQTIFNQSRDSRGFKT